MGITGISWGIIGCGDVTEVKSGPAFGKVPQSRLLAVMRRNAQKAADYAQRHGVPVWYDDAERLIQDPEITAVYVATPPSSHEKYTIEALRAGKPVYVEKPMSTDAASARRMMETADEVNVPLTVAHYRRQLPYFLAIRELIGQGTIGPVRDISITYLQPVEAKGFAPHRDNWRLNPEVSGGGIFHDLAPHQLDLMLYYFGEPVNMKGFSANRGGHYDADDFVSGSMEFSGDIHLEGQWDFNASVSETVDRCVISGTKGKILFSFFTMKEFTVETNGQTRTVGFPPLSHVQQPMIEKVVQHFLQQAPNPCPATDGVTVMEMIDAFTVKR